jgi:hypothetical protein
MVRIPILLLRWRIKLRCKITSKRIRYGVALSVLGAMCLLLVAWALKHQGDPDWEFKVYGFAVAWFPLAISVFAAFIPDLEKWGKQAMVTWRVAIVVLGLAWSWTLWHYQALTIEASRLDQTRLLESANRHTDPPVPAKLRFTLWEEDPGLTTPILSYPLRPDIDGVFNVDFTVENVSSTTGHSIDVWVDLCTDCSFAKEPEGFDRPKGMRDATRHLTIPLLNGGASFVKSTIAVKLSKPVNDFEVGLRYSCEACGGHVMPTQVAKIIALPPGLPDTHTATVHQISSGDR